MHSKNSNGKINTPNTHIHNTHIYIATHSPSLEQALQYEVRQGQTSFMAPKNDAVMKCFPIVSKMHMTTHINN